MRKLLFVPERYADQSGGVAVSANRLTRGLAARGWPVAVLQVTDRLAPARMESDCYEGVTVHRLGRAPEEDETCQLVEGVVAAFLEQGRAEVVVAFFAGNWGLAALHGARGRASLACLRGNDLDRGVYRAKLPLERGLRLASRVACVTREQVDKLRHWFGLEGVYIPNAVDGSKFFPGISSGDEILVCGEIRFKKGLDLILQVAQEWTDGPVIRLQGGLRGPDKGRYNEWRRAHPQAAPRVLVRDYTGDREQLRRHYQEAALVWHPALWEGMPNAVLEAMACGRVVLANAVGGCRDLIEDGRSGFLLGLHQLDQSGARLRELLALAPSQKQTVGEAARQRVLDHHRPEQELTGYEELLNRL